MQVSRISLVYLPKATRNDTNIHLAYCSHIAWVACSKYACYGYVNQSSIFLIQHTMSQFNQLGQFYRTLC